MSMRKRWKGRWNRSFEKFENVTMLERNWSATSDDRCFAFVLDGRPFVESLRRVCVSFFISTVPFSRAGCRCISVAGSRVANARTTASGQDRTENKEETLSIRTPFARRRRRIGARSSGLADDEYIQYTHSTRERRIEGDKKRTKRAKRTRDNERKEDGDVSETHASKRDDEN